MVGDMGGGAGAAWRAAGLHHHRMTCGEGTALSGPFTLKNWPA